MKKASSLCIAFGLYPAGRFAPTRLNPGDAPSRLVDIPDPVPYSLHAMCDSSGLWSLAKLSSLKRWAANWARLVLLLHPSIIALLASSESVRKSPKIPIENHEWSLDFDSTLGFPGEGPRLIAYLALPLFFSSWWEGSAVGPAGADSHGDAMRKLARAGIVLTDGRRVTQMTSNNRDWLFGNLLNWSIAQGYDLQSTLFGSPVDVDALNTILVAYGRWLFEEGKPYYHFSETLNSVTSRRPVIRRSLQQSWDLAFLWGSFEPVVHHLAMPPQVLIAVVSVALAWGWAREASLFALAWGALLRIGEIYQAYRRDVVFPQDVGGTTDFILMRLLEPKTRFRAARHQSAKMDADCLVGPGPPVRLCKDSPDLGIAYQEW